MYLGLPIGGDAHRLEFWQHVLNCISDRLSSWNSRLLCGRRSVLGSVLLCCMILFCMIILVTGGNGCSIMFIVIPWKGLIIFLHRWMSLLLWVYSIMFGINMFCLKFLYLLDDFFATVYPRRIILWGVVSFTMMLTSVLEGAVFRRPLAIYF